MRIFKAVHTVLCHVNTSPVIYQLSNRESSRLIFPISRREIVAQHEMIGNRCGCQLLSSLSHIQGTNWCSRILVSRILVSVGSVYMVSVAVVGFQLQSVVSCIHVMKSCSAWVFACSFGYSLACGALGITKALGMISVRAIFGFPQVHGDLRSRHALPI